MAKKKIADPTVEEGKLTVISASEAEPFETPKELAPVVAEYGLTLADDKVHKHVVTFSPFVKSLVDYEAELTPLLSIEHTPERAALAKELQTKYQKVRTGALNVKKQEKEEIVVEGRFLDKLNKVIEEAAAIKEAQCAEIVNLEETLENARKESLKTYRKTALEALDYDTDFMDLVNMPEESFLKILGKAKEIKEGLDSKKQKDVEEEAERTRRANVKLTRINALAALGMAFDLDLQGYEGLPGFLGLGMVNDGDDKAFEIAIAELRNKAAELKATKEENDRKEKEAKDRITNRINAVTKLGLTYDTVLESYVGYEQKITLKQVQELPAQDFTDTFELARDMVAKAKKVESDAQAKKDQEAAEVKKKADADAAEVKRLQELEKKRIADEKAEKDKKAAEAKALLLAPDKEKFKAFYVALKAVQVPDFATEEGKIVGVRMTEGLQMIYKLAVQEAAKLA